MSTEQRPIRVAVGRPASASPASASASRRAPAATPAATQTPLIDIHDAPEGLILEADLPGATEEDVVIQVEDNVLSLRARVTPPIPEGARPLHEEYLFGE